MPRPSQSRFPCGRLYVSSTHTLDSGLSPGRSHLLSFRWANNSINVCSFDQYHLVLDVRLLNSKKTGSAIPILPVDQPLSGKSLLKGTQQFPAQPIGQQTFVCFEATYESKTFRLKVCGPCSSG